MIRPDLRSHPRKTTVIAKRLAFLEAEHADVARLWSLITADMIALRDSQPKQDARIHALVGLTAALVSIMGAEPGTTAIWVLAMGEDGDTGTVEDLAGALIEQIMLVQTDAAGEA